MDAAGLGDELDGIVVVALEQAVAAPYTSLLLADAGARVIKVERPEGDFCRYYDRGADGESVWFAWLNRGKQSIVVDLKNDNDAAFLNRMIARADVFLHNLSPDALDRHGFSADILRKGNPGLINLQISGYGTEGKGANMKAYDFLVQAESGVCAVTGSADQPARVGVSLCDIATGLTAFSAILRALLKRQRTGKGLDLSISMFDVMADWMNMPLLAHRYLPASPARTGLSHAMLSPYGAYGTGDGGKIVIAVQNQREWRALCTEVLKSPALADDPRFADNAARLAHRTAVDDAINRVFSTLPRDTLATILGNARIAWSHFNTLDDLEGHPFLREITAHFGKSALKLADLPVKTGRLRPTHVPRLGEHSALIRREFTP